MKGFIIGLIGLFAVGEAQAQTVDEVISRHLNAMGGAANIRAIKSIRMVGSIQANGKSAPVTIQAVNHKGMRMDVMAQGMTQTTSITDSLSWMTNPFMGQPDPEPMPSEQPSLTDQLDLAGGLIDYQAKGHKVSLLGKERMGNEEVYKLKLTHKSGKIEYDYIDATTYLLARTTSVQRLNGEDKVSDSWSSDYRKVNGYSFAYTIKIRSAGDAQNQVINFNSIDVNPSIDEQIFRMPVKK